MILGGWELIFVTCSVVVIIGGVIYLLRDKTKEEDKTGR